MVPRVGKRSSAARAAIVCAVLAALTGCGSSARNGLSAPASANQDPPASASLDPVATGAGGCAATVLGVLGKITMRVYHEGVSSERAGSAVSLVTQSIPLREALERDDPAGARAAARALLATGHMTNLRVTTSAGRMLAEVEGRP